MYRVYLLYSNWLWELIRGLISAIELLWRPLYWIEQDHKRSTFLTFLPWLSLGSMLRELSWEQKESLTRCTAAGRTRAKNTLDGQEVESTTHSATSPLTHVPHKEPHSRSGRFDLEREARSQVGARARREQRWGRLTVGRCLFCLWLALLSCASRSAGRCCALL